MCDKYTLFRFIIPLFSYVFSSLKLPNLFTPVSSVILVSSNLCSLHSLVVILVKIWFHLLIKRAHWIPQT